MPLDLYADDEPVQVQPPPAPKQSWGNIFLICAVVVLIGMLVWNKLPVTPLGPTSDSLSVLIVEDAENRSLMPAELLASYKSLDVVKWLEENCKDKNGDPTWRVVDQQSDLSKDKKIFMELKSLPRDSIPWIYISPKSGRVVSKKLETKEKTLELLKPYEGK